MKLLNLVLTATLLMGTAEASVKSFKQRRIHAAPNAKYQFNYYGGPVISHAKVYTVFWGPAISQEIKTAMPVFYSGLVNSTYMDWLSEYSTNRNAINGRPGTMQTIGRGSYGGTIMITPSARGVPNRAGTLSEDQIRAELELQVNAGKLPQPTADSLFMLHFPSGVKITIPDGNGGIATSCQAFCAFHGGFTTKKGLNLFYSVIPDLGAPACMMGCGPGTTMDRTTVSASHEIIEAVTDGFPTPGSHPDFPQAWNTADGLEVSDVCQGKPGKVQIGPNSFAVSQNYSITKNACTTGNYLAR